MSYAKNLRESREKASVAFHEFALNASKFRSHLFCFFEGEKGTDNPYYVPRIKTKFSDQYPIRCGGKKHVLKVYDLIKAKAEYEKYKTAYFIDKDFDSSQAAVRPNLFETPCYSIENLYVSASVFSEILKNTLSITPGDAEYDKCMTLFCRLQGEYHNAVLLFNAWYSLLIDMRNTNGINTGVNLDDKLPDGFISFKLDHVEKKYTIETIGALFPNAPKVDHAAIDERLEYFKSCDMCKVLRGKYELYFVTRFIDMLITDSKTKKCLIGVPINTSFGLLSNDQAISVFSGYAETPKKLLDYIDSLVPVCIVA